MRTSPPSRRPTSVASSAWAERRGQRVTHAFPPPPPRPPPPLPSKASRRDAGLSPRGKRASPRASATRGVDPRIPRLPRRGRGLAIVTFAAAGTRGGRPGLRRSRSFTSPPANAATAAPDSRRPMPPSLPCPTHHPITPTRPPPPLTGGPGAPAPARTDAPIPPERKHPARPRGQPQITQHRRDEQNRRLVPITGSSPAFGKSGRRSFDYRPKT